MTPDTQAGPFATDRGEKSGVQKSSDLRPRGVENLRQLDQRDRALHDPPQFFGLLYVDGQKTVRNVSILVTDDAACDQESPQRARMKLEFLRQRMHAVQAARRNDLAKHLFARPDRDRVKDVLAKHVPDRPQILPVLVIGQPLVKTTKDQLRASVSRLEAPAIMGNSQRLADPILTPARERPALLGGTIPLIGGQGARALFRPVKDQRSHHLRRTRTLLDPMPVKPDGTGLSMEAVDHVRLKSGGITPLHPVDERRQRIARLRGVDRELMVPVIPGHVAALDQRKAMLRAGAHRPELPDKPAPAMRMRVLPALLILQKTSWAERGLAALGELDRELFSA